MRKHFFVLILAALVSGCAMPQQVYYHKTGGTLAQKQNDFDVCKMKSFQKIPQTMVSEVHPGYYNPGTVSCNTFGTYTSCQNIGAVNIPASVTTSDANVAMRGRFLVQCMRSKGYAAVVMPTCGLGEHGYDGSGKAPPLSRIKCLEPNVQALD